MGSEGVGARMEEVGLRFQVELCWRGEARRGTLTSEEGQSGTFHDVEATGSGQEGYRQ